MVTSSEEAAIFVFSSCAYFEDYKGRRQTVSCIQTLPVTLPSFVPCTAPFTLKSSSLGLSGSQFSQGLSAFSFLLLLWKDVFAGHGIPYLQGPAHSLAPSSAPTPPEKQPKEGALDALFLLSPEHLECAAPPSSALLMRKPVVWIIIPMCNVPPCSA